MKRFLLILIATLLALPLFGCSKQANLSEEQNNSDVEMQASEIIEFEGAEEIVFTAEKPVYDISLGDRGSHKNFYSVEKNVELYKDFATHYQENIKQEIDGSIYLLKDRAYDEFLNKWIFLRSDGIQDEKYINPCVEEIFALNEEDFLPSEKTRLKELMGSIILNFYSVPIKSETVGNKLRLEFGDNYETEATNLGISNTYVNLYSGDMCFATCYYELQYENPKHLLTYKWFTDYFKDNLMLIK